MEEKDIIIINNSKNEDMAAYGMIAWERLRDLRYNWISPGSTHLPKYLIATASSGEFLLHKGESGVSSAYKAHEWVGYHHIEARISI